MLHTKQYLKDKEITIFMWQTQIEYEIIRAKIKPWWVHLVSKEENERGLVLRGL